MYIFQPDRFLLQKQIKSLSNYMRGKILDIGAGEYSRYKDFFDFDEYIKMDVSEGDNVDVIGNVESIPFEDSTFDAVICTQVFEHLKHPQISAKEVFRVLKSGGYLLVTIPQMNELHEEPNDFFRYTNYGLKVVFEDVGFCSIEYLQRGGFFSVIAQIRIRYLIDKFDLYKKPILGRLVGKFLYFYGKFMLWLDFIDKSKANRKHAIGWSFVFKK